MIMKFFFIMVCSFLLCGCSSKMEGSAQVTQDNGEITTAKVILKDNKIQEVSIDETVADVDKTKKQLQNSYGMKQASSIGKEWYEQVLFFEDYVKTHGIENIKTDEKGKSVGLKNVYRRLSLYYGDRMTFDIESVVGRGTICRICIPL